jgi:hypothetical protein
MKRKLFAVKTVARLATFAAVAMIIALADEALTNRAAAQSSGPLVGRVQVGGKPVADATVTLYAAGTGAPQRLGEDRTSANGAFTLDASQAPLDSILYVVAKAPKVSLLTLLGSTPAGTVTVDEFTTVASAFTAAQFIKDGAISGNPLGLRIAAMNVPNFVNLQTGGWGSVIIDPLNSNRSTTLATFNTLASLITAAATVASDDWRSRFFQAATPTGGETP